MAAAAVLIDGGYVCSVDQSMVAAAVSIIGGVKAVSIIGDYGCVN